MERRKIPLLKMWAYLQLPGGSDATVNILWLIPPLEGFPNISQYRFFKRMHIRDTIIYPYLAASGVTQLDKAGNDVPFMDSPTLAYDWKDVDPWLHDVDLVIMEART